MHLLMLQAENSFQFSGRKAGEKKKNTKAAKLQWNDGPRPL